MIGISIAAKIEWKATLDYYQMSEEECNIYPYGSYFTKTIHHQTILFYWCGNRKVCSSAANQYMILKFNLTKVIVAGTCAGIDPNYHELDLIMPDFAVQYDTSVEEIEPLIKERYNVLLNVDPYDVNLPTGMIASADKAVVMWKDYLELRKNDVTIADTEAAAIAYVCRKNQVECLIVKGISDFPRKCESKEDVMMMNEQFDTFLSNTPKIMQNIFENYLPKLL